MPDAASLEFTVGLDTSALDPAFKAHAARGIGRYVQELKGYFDSHASKSLKVGFFDHRSIVGPRMIDAAIERLPAGRQTVRQQIVYPLRLNSSDTGKFNVLHFPAHMDAPSWSIKRYILTVLDLIPLVCSDLYRAARPGWRFKLARWLEIRAIKNASLILAISENTAEDVHRLLGVPRERIVVTPLGVDERFFIGDEGHNPAGILRKYSIPENRPLVLYVGGIDPRKNTGMLLRSFVKLLQIARERGEVEPLLMLAGKIQTDREFPALAALVKSLDLESHVLLPGFVPDQDLLRVYSISSAFFFPSLYEGFGLPPLEAMAAGLPVVSSNTSAMPEILGDAALSIDPHDEAGAARALHEIIHNRELALSLREKGRARARLYSWDGTGTKTLRAYEEFASGRYQ
jgi:glycosyltransferase involved in cell wall biosynthesis